MRKIIRGLKKLKANSFTLVELLVVISIIGLLAGLAVPAIQGGLDKAKQGVDVSNARQLGIIFFSEANDNNGIYRVNGDLTNTQAAGNFLTILQGMFSNGVLSSAKILSGQGVIPANSTNAVTAANIAFGSKDIQSQDIINAATMANAHEFISSLPNGYNTPIGDRGILLSGGQRQRLAIARALARQPEILIFDEATSALDAESERLVQEAISVLLKGRTAIIIAHRLSTIIDADCIYVFDEGRITESGTHQELMHKGGMYSRLCALQSIEA